MGGRARLALILAVVVPLTALLLPVQWIAIRFRYPLRRRLPHLWHRLFLRLLGVRVTVIGTPAASGHTGALLAANHASWLDIPVLGAAAPVSFVAKSEVAGWTGIALLARLQETVFVSRGARRQAGQQAGSIRSRLAEGDAIVLFPEGTTSDGNFVLPFKSALFGAAGSSGEDALLVQPVAIVYRDIHGIPMGRYDRPVAAWPGDTPLAPHLLQLAAQGHVGVTVVFGEPLAAGESADRKRLAAVCEAAVREMVSASLLGRTTLPSETEKV
ncbi:lysophospholipid acyltransferase family protein [Oricola sp.]|uniref:lysophospholipid acyltransferase family protein n=1 Tax=Oricola sp. TaxID=1979950 RepID=UPI003BAB86E0